MLEFLLHGGVPESRFEQILSVLAGIAGMPPRRSKEDVLIYRPNRNPIQRSAFLAGPSDVQQSLKKTPTSTKGDHYYLQLVCINQEEPCGSDRRFSGDDGMMNVDERKPEAPRDWELRFYDNPETGNLPVTSRMVGFIPILDGDPVTMMEGLDYAFCRHYSLERHSFVHHHVLVSMHRIYQSDTKTKPDSKRLQATTEGQQLYDSSGSYMLEASVRLEDNTDSKLVESAVNELQRLQDTLKGVVELRKIDRMALMTRILAGPGS